MRKVGPVYESIGVRSVPTGLSVLPDEKLFNSSWVQALIDAGLFYPYLQLLEQVPLEDTTQLIFLY